MKTPARALAGRLAENIAAVRENVADNSGTSIRQRAQKLGLALSTAILQPILTKETKEEAG